MCDDVSANKSLYGNERETPSTRSLLTAPGKVAAPPLAAPGKVAAPPLTAPGGVAAPPLTAPGGVAGEAAGSPEAGLGGGPVSGHDLRSCQNSQLFRHRYPEPNTVRERLIEDG